jgi:HD superfamily phosphodiesterase
MTVIHSSIDMAQVMNSAFAHMIANQNFVHTPLHSVRVYENMQNICEGEDLSFTKAEIAGLTIACFWHDTGRLDTARKKDNHHKKSVALLKEFNKGNNIIPIETLDIAVSIIEFHRNRDAVVGKNDRSILQNVFWDADKLDIFNPRRMREIIGLYRAGISGGEFTPEQTFDFWNSINDDLIEKFSFNISRSIARNQLKHVRRITLELKQELL